MNDSAKFMEKVLDHKQKMEKDEKNKFNRFFFQRVLFSNYFSNFGRQITQNYLYAIKVMKHHPLEKESKCAPKDLD